MKYLLSKRTKLFVCSFFLFFCNHLFSQEPFIPKEKLEACPLPPFKSDLLKDQREIEEKKERKDIENIVRKVVKGEGKDLEQQAEALIKDKKKLERFLDSFEGLGDENKLIKPIDNVLKLHPQLSVLLYSFYKDPQLENRKVTLKLKNTDVREVIELIGKAANIDFIIDREVKGVVNNIYIKNVSVASVLKIILSSNKPILALVKDLGVWRILTLKDALFFLSDKARELYCKDFVTSYITINNTKWTERLKLSIEKMWHSMISEKAKDCYLVFDDNTKNVFFRGRKRVVQDFKNYLKQIDEHIPSVRIDARIVIAGKDFEESFGLQSSGIYNRSSSVSQGWNFIGFGPVTTPDGSANIKSGNLMDWALNLLPTTASQFLNIPFILGGKNLNTKRLNLVLNAAENRSEIETILKPSLLVNSGELAEILVGQEVPIETSIQERIEGSLRDVNTISYKSLGMKLKVRPIVSPNEKTVFLDIFVENSYIKDGTMITLFDAKKSIIVSNRSKNKVLLKNGQTTLIGGLISNEKRILKQGIPILQKIPILGALFRGSKRVKKDDQLMIFISPTIV